MKSYPDAPYALAELDNLIVGRTELQEAFELARTDLARADAELDEARTLLRALRQDLADLRRVHEESVEERARLTSFLRNLRERVAAWELSATPRLLGLAPDQLLAVRDVLRELNEYQTNGGIPSLELVEEAWRRWCQRGSPMPGGDR